MTEAQIKKAVDRVLDSADRAAEELTRQVEIVRAHHDLIASLMNAPTDDTKLKEFVSTINELSARRSKAAKLRL